jgi:hypothetical protein
MPPQVCDRCWLVVPSASRLGDTTVEPGRETPRASLYGNTPSRIWAFWIEAELGFWIVE